MLLPQLQRFMEILEKEKWEALLLKLVQCCDSYLHKPASLIPCLHLVQDIMMDQFSHRNSQRGRQTCALRTDKGCSIRRMQHSCQRIADFAAEMDVENGIQGI